MTKAEVVAPAADRFGAVRRRSDRAANSWSTSRSRADASSTTRYPLAGRRASTAQAARRRSACRRRSRPTAPKHVTIEDGEIAHVGGYALWFRRGCQNCRVERCLIHDMGGGGVHIGQGWDNEQPEGRRRHRALHRRQQYHPLRRPSRPRRRRRLDRPQRLQPGHPQRHRRFPLHRRLRRLASGAMPPAKPITTRSSSTTSIISAGAC